MNIKIENWQDHKIRFVEIENEWLAVAKDLSDALGYANSNKMTRYLDKDEVIQLNWKKKQTPDIVLCFEDYKYKSKIPLVYETGIYEAIFNSQRPEAKEFKKWVKQLLKQLREAIGLQQYQVFDLVADKEIQKQAMEKISKMNEPTPVHYMKANTIANKAVANKYGLPKAVKKDEMTPEMLQDRQPILEDTAHLMLMKDKFELDLSVSKTIYKKWN